MLHVIALRAHKHLRMVRDEYLGRDKADKMCVRLETIKPVETN